MCIKYVSMNSFPITKVVEMGIPFFKDSGRPKLSNCCVPNWEFLLQNVCSVKWPTWAPKNNILDILSLVTINLCHKEYNSIISDIKITMDIVC